MSYLTTVNDLRADALFRAGEPTTDTTGSFWTKSVEYLNRIQRDLMLGGGIAVGRDLASSAGIYAHLVDMPVTDWWWARSKGVITTTARIQRTITASILTGDTAVNVTSDVTTDISGWFVRVADRQPTVVRVSYMTNATNINFDSAWPDPAVSGTVDFVKLIYDLPADFIRFAAPPFVHTYAGSGLPVASREQQIGSWPLTQLAQGAPNRVFLVGPQQVQLNAWDTRPYRLEFEYVALPPDMVGGGLVTSGIPVHQRQVLSVGAAMLMAFDKGDGRAANLASEFREIVRRMAQEHRRALTGGSPTFCTFKVRCSDFVARTPQAYGEMFLL